MRFPIRTFLILSCRTTLQPIQQRPLGLTTFSPWNYVILFHLVQICLYTSGTNNRYNFLLSNIINTRDYMELHFNFSYTPSWPSEYFTPMPPLHLHGLVLRRVIALFFFFQQQHGRC